MKVHMKTHGDDASSGTIKIKVSKPTESKPEECKLAKPESPKPAIQINPGPVKTENTVKVEAMPKMESTLRPTPYKRMHHSNISGQEYSNGDANR